jgi:hypothetical protein
MYAWRGQHAHDLPDAKKEHYRNRFQNVFKRHNEYVCILDDYQSLAVFFE